MNKKQFKKYINKGSFYQVCSLLFWLFFRPEKWQVFTKQYNEGKTFKAAFDEAKNNEK